MFVSKMADCDAEATETQVWLDFARDCGYLSREPYEQLITGHQELGRTLNGMIAKADSFAPARSQPQARGILLPTA
jgi:four helix bundle protein